MLDGPWFGSSGAVRFLNEPVPEEKRTDIALALLVLVVLVMLAVVFGLIDTDQAQRLLALIRRPHHW
jgi:hypothetical protein